MLCTVHTVSHQVNEKVFPSNFHPQKSLVISIPETEELTSKPTSHDAAPTPLGYVDLYRNKSYKYLSYILWKQKRFLAYGRIKIVFYYQCIKFRNTSGSGFILCQTDISNLPTNTACFKLVSIRPLVRGLLGSAEKTAFSVVTATNPTT